MVYNPDMQFTPPRAPKPHPDAVLSESESATCANCRGALWKVPVDEPTELTTHYYDGYGWFNASQCWFCSIGCRIEACEQDADAGEWPYCSECGQRVLCFARQTGVREDGSAVHGGYDGPGMRQLDVTDDGLLVPNFLCEHIDTARVLGIAPDAIDRDAAVSLADD
jgi:hypothetical protein